MNHENGRVKRGLYLCPVTGIKINTDLNAARNIAKKVGYETPMPKKILSFIITTNGVKPLTPKEGATTKTPKINPAPKGRGGGHIFNPVLPKLTYSISEVS
jgi:putative transposase